MADAILQFLPLQTLQCVFAFLMYRLARRLGANAWLWAVLILIPVIGAFAFWGCVIRSLFVMAGKLKAAEAASTTRA